MIENDIGANVLTKDEFLDELWWFARPAGPDSYEYKTMRDYVKLSREQTNAEILRDTMMATQMEDNAIIAQTKHRDLIALDVKVATLEANIEKKGTGDEGYNKAYSFITTMLESADQEKDPEIKEAITAFRTEMFMQFPFE